MRKEKSGEPIWPGWDRISIGKVLIKALVKVGLRIVVSKVGLNASELAIPQASVQLKSKQQLIGVQPLLVY
jgi:hypothetical protein